MKNVFSIFFIFNFLISFGQVEDSKNKLEININDINFASISYNKPVENSYNQIEIRELNKQQFDELLKNINDSKPRGFCKLGVVYRIKTFLKNDSIRVFKGNSNTVKEKGDLCFTLPNNTFYSNLWNKSDLISIDYSNIAILPYSDFNFQMFEIKKKAELSKKELKEIELILKNKLDYKKLKSLEKYFRQYVSVFNKNNEKEVWINFLCKTQDSKWKDERVIVKDGGNCYFNVKLNLNTGKIIEININGEA